MFTEKWPPPVAFWPGIEVEKRRMGKHRSVIQSMLSSLTHSSTKKGHSGSVHPDDRAVEEQCHRETLKQYEMAKAVSLLRLSTLFEMAKAGANRGHLSGHCVPCPVINSCVLCK